MIITDQKYVISVIYVYTKIGKLLIMFFFQFLIQLLFPCLGMPLPSHISNKKFKLPSWEVLTEVIQWQTAIIWKVAAAQIFRFLKSINYLPYDVRVTVHFSLPLVKFVYHGLESIPYSGPQVWEMLPNIYKKVDFLKNCKDFKVKIAYLAFLWSGKHWINE